MGAEEEAWVTLATNDSYALGALVLSHSLRRVGTTRRLVALVTPGVTMAMRDQLSATFDLVELVNVLDSGDAANLALLSRPDLGVTFTKLHCWRLTQFSKCVFLDADTLVLQPCEELFDREELSAAPDAGWPDCFNSGVFVYRPSYDTYQRLMEFAVSKGSFDGGDQGLLNSFFSDWATKDISRHLPFIYNMCSTATYSYLPAFKKYGETVRIAHFIGASKPWMQPFDSETRQVRVGPGQEHQRMLLQLWWDIFCLHVHPHLSLDMGGLAAAFSKMTLGAPKSEEQNALEEHLRKEAWELGQVDYLGQDSFDNVWKKIMQTLTSGPAAPVAQPPPSEPPLPSAPTSPPPSAPVPPPPSAPVPPPPSAPVPPPPSAPVPPPPSAPIPPPPSAPIPPPPSAPIPPPPSKRTPPSPTKQTPPSPTKQTPPPPTKQTPPSPTKWTPSSAPIFPSGDASMLPKQHPATPSRIEATVTTSPLPEQMLPPSPPSPSQPLTSPPVPSSPPTASTKVASPEQKESGAAVAAVKQVDSKQASAKVSPGPPQASEDAARGPVPVAPKRRGGGQQQAGGGRGKSGGQKGKK